MQISQERQAFLNRRGFPGSARTLLLHCLDRLVFDGPRAAERNSVALGRTVTGPLPLSPTDFSVFNPNPNHGPAGAPAPLGASADGDCCPVGEGLYRFELGQIRLLKNRGKESAAARTCTIHSEQHQCNCCSCHGDEGVGRQESCLPPLAPFSLE